MMRKFEFLSKADLVDEHGYHHFFDVVQQEYIDSLKAENERLKAELKKWEDRSKVVKDGYDGEVYEWEGNYYIVTPYLNVFVKGLLKENAKLRCLALHGMIGYAVCKMNIAAEKYKDDEMCDFAVPIEFSKWHRKEIEWTKAYRKAKKALMEGK